MDVNTGGDAPRDVASEPAADAGPDRADARDATDAFLDVTNDVTNDVTIDVALDRPADLRTEADPPEAAPPDTVVYDGPPLDAGVDNANLPPTIAVTVPADMATGVAVAATITVEFSKPMNTATVAVVLNPAATLGTANWNMTNTSVAFTPPSPLASNTAYTATVTGTDTGGRALAGVTTFSFTTGAPPDTTPPTVTASVPANGATDVPANTQLSITFSEPMDIGSVQVTSTPDIMLGMPTWNMQYDQVSFPTAPLVPSTDYALSVTGQDRARNQLTPSPTNIRFRTAMPPDTTPPTVSSVAPTNGATSVPNNTSIVITFSETMNLMATTNALSISPAVTCNGGWSWNVGFTTATCVPTSVLSYSTTYTVGVSTGAQDAAGNALAAAFSSSFTTGVAPDTTPPTIVSVVPGNGATAVPRGAVIVVNFSEAMDINATQAAFAVTAPGGISGTFAWYNGNTQMVFTPTALWVYGTTVSWQVSTGARDAAGNNKTTLDSYVFYVIKSTTVTLPCLSAAMDAHLWATLPNGVANINPSYIGLAIGWYAGGSAPYRGLETFDMSPIPANATAITSATMYFQQYQIAGTVYGAANLGALLWRHVDFGPTLDAADFYIAQLPHTSSGGTLSTDATLGWKASAVTLSLRDDLANRVARGNRSQFLLRMTNDSDASGTNQWAYVYSCDQTVVTDRPYIQVTYEYP